MKKIFKSKIIILLFCSAILFSGIAFAYSIIASDVGFTPKDEEWNVDNVKDALDDMRKYFTNGYINLSNPTATSRDDERIITSSNNVASNEYAINAFDQNASTFWTTDPNQTLPQYLGWDFKEQVAVYDFTITNRLNMTDTTVGQFTLQGYRKGQWENIQSYNHTNTTRGSSTKYKVDYPKYYYKYRIMVTTEGYRNANYIQIAQLDFNYIKPNSE